jgi:hypothetical protein
MCLLGLLLCSHKADAIRKKSFSNIRLSCPTKEAPYCNYIGSRSSCWTWRRGTDRSFTASNNQPPLLVDTSLASRNNNDHVKSFDDTMLTISDESTECICFNSVGSGKM